jgi:hypothetical protein
MRSGRKFAVEWPPVPPEGREFVRRIVIDTGLPYDIVTVAAGTVVDVDENGQPVRSTGGRLARPKDGLSRLLGLAKLAAAWYTIPHVGLTLTTTRLQGDDAIELGSMVTRIGDDVAPLNTHQRYPNSVVTEIRIQWPEGTASAPPPAPVMTVSTDATELDPLQIAPAALDDGANPFKPRRIIKL